MSIFRTPYNTTVGSAAVINKITDAIKVAMIKEPIAYTTCGVHNEEVPAFFVTGKYPSEGDIPFFAHPMEVVVRDSATKENKSYVVSDVRMMLARRGLSGDVSEGVFRIRNHGEYMFSVCRTALSTAWLTERPGVLRDISFVPAGIFSSWIAEAVSSRRALDAKDHQSILVIAGIFYQSLFMEGSSFAEEDKPKIAQAVMRATHAPSTVVFDFLEKIDRMGSIADFCYWCRELLENPGLKDFNEGALVTILGNTWYGTNAKEILAVALEHPPTWLALVFYSFTERSFKNSTISRIALRYMGRKGEDDFVKSFSAIFRTYCNPEEALKV